MTDLDPSAPFRYLRRREAPDAETLDAQGGLVVAADSPDEIAELSSWVMSTVVAELGVGGADDGRLPRGREPEPPDAGRTRALVDALGPSLPAPPAGLRANHPCAAATAVPELCTATPSPLADPRPGST